VPAGLGIDAMMEADREWFAAHPSADVRYRPMQAAERAEFDMYGYSETARMTHIQVIQVAPGFRVRHPYGGGHRAYSARQAEQVRARFRAVAGAA
jgi:hypothetical protein